MTFISPCAGGGPPGSFERKAAPFGAARPWPRPVSTVYLRAHSLQSIRLNQR